MRAMIVDDEQIMLRSFMRLSKGIENLDVIAQFESPEEALVFAQENLVELAFLDIKMPGMNGIDLAVRLREICPSILIVFISAYDEYIRDSNLIGGDYYIVMSRPRQHRHLKRKNSILFLVFLDFPHFFIHSGWQDTLF